MRKTKLIMVATLSSVAITAYGGSATPSETTAAVTATETTTAAETTAAAEGEAVPETEATKEEEPVEDESIPTEYKSTLKKAGSYSDMMHMPKIGIFKQLTSEYGDKFSEEAVQYAVGNMTVDWNDNALKEAQDYSETTHMPKQGVYDQLTSEYGEQSTPEEAQYAINNVTADWKANALAKTRDYQDIISMSPEATRNQLSSEFGEKFTREEAAYAIESLDWTALTATCKQQQRPCSASAQNGFRVDSLLPDAPEDVIYLAN